LRLASSALRELVGEVAPVTDVPPGGVRRSPENPGSSAAAPRCGGLRADGPAQIGEDLADGLRDRAKITSPFLAGPFARRLRCSLLTDPLAGYARRSRLASGQNSCAIKGEVIFARSLSGAGHMGISGTEVRVGTMCLAGRAKSLAASLPSERSGRWSRRPRTTTGSARPPNS